MSQNSGGVFLAFGRALRSQFHPRMLALALVPLVLIPLAGVLLFWFLWEPAAAGLQSLVGGLSWFKEMAAVIEGWGLGAVFGFMGSMLVPVFLFVAIFSLAMLLALVVVSIFGMPIVISHLLRADYPDVLPRHGAGTVAVVAYVIYTAALFLLFYVLSIPFWLIPPLFVGLPFIAWTWLNARLMAFDALSSVSDANERRALLRQHRGAFFVMGAVVSLLSTVPPLLFIMPVFSALVFAHFSLELLRRYRQGQTATATVAGSPSVLSPNEGHA